MLRFTNNTRDTVRGEWVRNAHDALLNTRVRGTNLLILRITAGGRKGGLILGYLLCAIPPTFDSIIFDMSKYGGAY